MFRKLLSPESQAKLEAKRTEINRLYHLPDRWLANELLRLAREVQPQLWAEGHRPADCVYDPAFAWQVIPEIAKRLGATSFRAQERTDPDVIRASNDDLRQQAAYCLLNSGTRPMRNSLLTTEVANGNPVAFAIDRIAAPGPTDPVGRLIREIARNREVECPDGRWSPGMMDYKHRRTQGLAAPQPNADELSINSDLDCSP